MDQIAASWCPYYTGLEEEALPSIFSPPPPFSFLLAQGHAKMLLEKTLTKRYYYWGGCELKQKESSSWI
jgi:hypothetical protein